MSLNIDVNKVDKTNWDDYSECFFINVDNDQVERILEGAVGRIEIHNDIVTRNLPDCAAKSRIPTGMFMVGFGDHSPNQHML
jgi:hypothetical protein